jgi:hypothetical protein
VDASLTPQHEQSVSISRAQGLLRYLLLGTFFGLVLIKSEVVSWYRIQEMFRFGSFHMYGVFATAIPTAMLSVALIKRLGVRAVTGEPITFTPKAPARYRYLLGGTLFGLGWGLQARVPDLLRRLSGAERASLWLSSLARSWERGLTECCGLNCHISKAGVGCGRQFTLCLAGRRPRCMTGSSDLAGVSVVKASVTEYNHRWSVRGSLLSQAAKKGSPRASVAATSQVSAEKAI